MFYVSKDSIEINTKVGCPVTRSTAKQDTYINGRKYCFIGEGETRCDEGNYYIANFGKELAETNAQINLLRRYKSELIKMTKQPDWMKPIPIREVIVEPGTYDRVNIPEIINVFNNSRDKRIKATIEVL